MRRRKKQSVREKEGAARGKESGRESRAWKRECRRESHMACLYLSRKQACIGMSCDLREERGGGKERREGERRGRRENLEASAGTACPPRFAACPPRLSLEPHQRPCLGLLSRLQPSPIRVCMFSPLLPLFFLQSSPPLSSASLLFLPLFLCSISCTCALLCSFLLFVALCRNR